MPIRWPRTIAFMRRLPISTTVGLPEVSGCSLTVVTGLPSMAACASGENFTVTSDPCNSKTPACAGPLGNTTALPASVPKLLSPGLSQNKPANDNQFVLRSSTSSAFHLSNDWRYAASGAEDAKTTPANSGAAFADTTAKCHPRLIPSSLTDLLTWLPSERMYIGQRLQVLPAENLIELSKHRRVHQPI